MGGEAAQVSVLSVGTHYGTHIDAPRHLLPGAVGVDALPLEALVGRCRVLEVRGPLIGPEDLVSTARGPRRLLLKTAQSGFWADAQEPREAAALSPAAAEWLVEQGFLLLGIDELSVDPPVSTNLDAHRILLAAGVVILEGLDLRAVPPGEYDLAALPLPLPDADGSPARVVLRSP